MRRLPFVVIAGAMLLLLAGGAWLLRESGSNGDGDTDAPPGLAAPAVVGRASDAATAEAPDLAAGQLAALAAESVRSPGVQRLAAGRTSGADAAWADAREISFRGRVLDERGAPIAGAVVVYWPNDVTQALYGVDQNSSGAALDGLPRTLTDAGGRFELRGRYREGRVAGGLHEWPSLVVLAGDCGIRSRACEHLEPGVACDAGDLAVEPGVHLVGRIVDAAGRPVAGAEVVPRNPSGVLLRGSNGEQEFGVRSTRLLLTAAFAATTSDAEGRFATGALWVGTTQLSVKAPGFQPLMRDSVPLRTSPTDIGDVVLADGLELLGVVRDERGVPVRDASVYAWEKQPAGNEARSLGKGDTLLKLLARHATSESTYVTTTDARGRFEIGSLKPGSFEILVDAAGFEPLLDAGEVPSGAAVRSLTLVRAATLRLTVLDAATSKPLAAATATARRFTDSERDTVGIELPVTRSGAPGTLLVERVGLQRTLLIIAAPGFATRRIELPGATPPEQLERTVALVRGATLAGEVVAEDGTPIEAAELFLSFVEAGGPELPASFGRGLTDARGHFLLNALSAGEWRVRAVKKGFGPAEHSLQLVAGEQREHERFVLPGAAVVFGSCLHADGTPKPGMSWSFFRVDLQGNSLKEPAVSLKSDAEGRYEQRNMWPGTWRSSSDSRLLFTLSPGEQRRVDLQDDPPATVKGRVLQASGRPVSDAWVFVHWSRPGGRDRSTLPVRADRDGYFVWDKDRPGLLEVVAASPTCGVSEAEVLELAPGEQRVVNLMLGSTSVAGRVLRVGDDAPVAGALVHLLPLLQGDVAGVYDKLMLGGESAAFGVARSDAEGRFVLEHLVPGRYSVAVEGEGVRAGPLPALDVGAQGAADLLFRVVATGSVSGTLRHKSGELWPGTAWVTAEGPDGRRVVPTQEGRFELADLMPGTWRVFVRDNRAVLAEQQVSVLSGRTTDVELFGP